MDTQRLVNALDSLRSELDRRLILKNLESIKDTAAAAAAAPTEAPKQTAFESAIVALTNSLKASDFDSAPVSTVTTIQSLALDDVVPSRILARFDEILNARPFLAQTASGKLADLATSVQQRLKRIDAILKSLAVFNIVPNEVDANQYEVGVLMPTELTHNELPEVLKQLKSWEHTFSHLTEFMKGHPPESLEIRSASTGSFDLFLSIDPKGAWAVLILVVGLMKVFSVVREKRDRHQIMEQEGYPSDVLDQLRKYEESLLGAKKGELKRELEAKASPQLDPSRKNELLVAIDKHIDFIAKSLNRGVRIEVSVPPPPDEEEGEASTDAHQLDAIREEMAQMRATIDALRVASNKAALLLPRDEYPFPELPAPSETSPSASNTTGPAK